MRTFVIFLLFCISSSFCGHSQTNYNNCSDALVVCPNTSYAINNIDATATVCTNCEDDFNFCFGTNNSIWLQFETNAMGGTIQVDFSNLLFESNPGQDNELQATILQAATPCDASTYTQIGNCVSNATGNFSLNAAGLLPTTTYYVIIDGDLNGAGITLPAEASFDVSISGSSVDRAPGSASLTGPTTLICPGDIVTYTTTLSNCPDNGSFEWYINGALVASTSVPFFQTTTLQDGDVIEVRTTCYNDCPELISATIGPVSLIDFPIDAGTDMAISPGESIFLAGSTTASTFNWTPTFLVSDPTSLTPIVSPTETTTFTLSATENGCTLFDQVTISVNSGLTIPNTFSPNDDQTNDTWVIEGIELYPDAQLNIYDRWGQQVFQSTGYSEETAWDGTSKRGAKLTSGTYYFVLELNDANEQVFNGYISLIR